MLNILWSIVNSALWLALYYLFFSAARLLKRHMGWGAALLFGLGILQLSSPPTATSLTSTATGNLLTDALPNAPLGNASAVQKVGLGSNKLEILAEYYQSDTLVRPRGLYATVSGVVAGHRWKPLSGGLTPSGRQLRYSVVLQHDWSLLGTVLYSSQAETFTGLMPAQSVTLSN